MTFGGQEFSIPFEDLLFGGGRGVTEMDGELCVFSPTSTPDVVGGSSYGYGSGGAALIIGDGEYPQNISQAFGCLNSLTVLPFSVLSQFLADILRSLYTVYRFYPPSVGVASLSRSVTVSENPQPNGLQDLPVQSLSRPPLAPTTPVSNAPSATLTVLVLPSKDVTAYWDTNTTLLPLQPTVLDTDASIPTPTFASQGKSNGGSSTQGASKGDKSGSEKTGSFSFSVAVGVALLSFVFSSVIFKPLAFPLPRLAFFFPFLLSCSATLMIHSNDPTTSCSHDACIADSF